MIALLLAAAASVPLAAQTTEPGTEPEAPATLLPFKIGDAAVEASIAGSWSVQTGFGAGLLVTPGGSVQPLDGFAGITTGFAFSQTPDLSLSITLLERWFLEVSVLAGFEDNSLLMGYRGDRGEPVQHVLFGNHGITAAPAPFIEVPDQAEDSLGISARVTSGIGTNEALLRWDAAGEQHRTYLGADELLEERIGVDAWVRGRYFVLPDADVQDLVVLLEDEDGTLRDGDGLPYRRAEADDVVVDAKAGRVTLRGERKGRVLVRYTKNGWDVGDAALGVGALAGQDASDRRDLAQPAVQFRWNMPTTYLGEDMDRRRITVSGVGACLLLWEPGDPSPFEAANTYGYSIAATVEATRFVAFLEKRASGADPPTDLLPARFDAAAKQVTLLVDSDFRSSFRNWYPFWKAPADNPVNLVYGPLRDALAGLLDFEIVVQALQPVDGYVLGSSVLPGSVRVTVNGVEERRFTLEPGTGRIAFQMEIAPSDRIEVRWRTKDAGSAGGDVLLTWRDDLRLAENLGLWVAAGLRWNVGTGLTAGDPYARSGALVAAAGLEGSAGALSWSVEAAGSYLNPDTTGVVRLYGMEGRSIEVGLSEERAWPAAPPDSSGPLSSFTAANRGRLLYRDYRSYDAFGGAELHAIDWPGYRPQPYADGGRCGPYNVLGTSAGDASGTSLVLEYDLPADGDWAGAQLPVVAGSFADLSTAKSVTLRMMGRGLAGSALVHLEIGAIGEDLDGDGDLDEEDSATSEGFPFNYDPAEPQKSLRIGAGPRLLGNRARDSEDRDGSGTLTPERPDRIVAWPAATVAGAWTTYRFDLDDAGRSRLQRARSVRIIVEADAAGTSGQVLIDRISVAGSSSWARLDTPAAVSVREVAEQLLGADDPHAQGKKRLEEVAPTAMARFHPSGETQEVLEMTWSGAVADVELTGYTAKTTGGIVYDTAAVYVRGTGILPASGSAIDFSLLDSAGAGIAWTVDAAELSDEDWHEISASRVDGTIAVDGTVVSGSLQALGGAHGELCRLEVVVRNSTDGTLFLDEVHLRDPRTAWGAALRAEASWSRTGAILRAGGVPLLANVSVDQKLSLATAGFTSLFGTPVGTGDFTSRTSLSADILYARLQADVVLRDVALEEADSGRVSSGSHRLTIPASASPVTFSDGFTLTGPQEFSREDTLHLQPLDALSVSIAANADRAMGVLSRAWSASVTARPLERLSLGLDLGFSQESTGVALADAWYGARWWEATRLLAPWIDAAAVERVEYLSADAAARFRSLDAALAIDASATSTDHDQESRIDVSWSVGWPAGRRDVGGLSVAVRYDQSLALRGGQDGIDSFAAEAADFFTLLADQRYFLLGLPVLQILLDDTEKIRAAWDGLEEASWKPSLSVSIERRSGSRLADLFVPAIAELSVARDLEKRADLPDNEILIKPRLVTRALNLFGRLGSHPLMPFYRTDEFSIAMSGAVRGSRVADLSLSTLTLELSAEIFGFKDQSLLAVNVFSLESEEGSATDSLQAVLAWATRPAGGVRLPYLPEPIAQSGYFEHRESLDLDLRFGGSPAHPLTLLLGHATSVVYPERGSIRAILKAGFDVESLSDAFAYRFAIEAGLEAKLTF